MYKQGGVLPASHTPQVLCVTWLNPLLQKGQVPWGLIGVTKGLFGV